MLGLLLLYFAGKAFYDLAQEHGRSRWGFAILGVLSYYAGLFIGGIIVTLIYEFGLSKSIEEVNEILVSLMALPFGVVICWGFYNILKSAWSKSGNEF